ncbi:hypothetical protein KUTeg_008023 [Tegillarca granosa]|uniref:Uncharacterized protein n=1 Tax=Tegillarca granosa TaxID=220873 RepID=A0ABQ9FEU4_TEGGR|nr:hypothetical protein KUTeg_008023 [Tegillarca granosa]
MIYGVELVGPTKRVITGVVIEYFWVTGVVILAGIAYALRDWFYIQLATSLPILIFALDKKNKTTATHNLQLRMRYIFERRAIQLLIPESARWLISKNKYKEAEKIIQKAAKVNKVTLTKDILDFKSLENPPKEYIWQLFTSKVLFLRSLVIFFNW